MEKILDYIRLEREKIRGYTKVKFYSDYKKKAEKKTSNESKGSDKDEKDYNSTDHENQM